MKLWYEKISRHGQLNPTLRSWANRYGRSYWRLPAALRRRICWEEDVPKLAGVEKFEIGPPEQVTSINPRLDAVLDPPTFGHRLVAQKYRSPAASVVRVPRAWLVGGYASPVTADGRLLLSAFRDAPRLMGLERHSEMEAWVQAQGWRQTSALPSLEHVWPMVSRLQANYYHWIVEWCGRLEWLEIYGRQTGRECRLLIPQGGPRYIRDSLTLLGYAEKNLLEWPTDSPPRIVEDMLLPSFRGASNASSPAALQWLRARFLKGANANESKPSRRVYVPRRPGDWRAVRNSEEVEACLQRRGFDIVEPHKLSFAEQVRCFSEAQLLVGLHGAAMTNVLFAPGAAVLELFGHYGDGAYCGMTARLNQTYRVMRCQEAKNHDVVVDLDALQRQIDAMDDVRGTGGVARHT